VGHLVRALTWNLAHGRDHPPDRALLTWRSRLARTTERNATHAQVNRPLGAEFGRVLAREEWDLALLQEAPPRWLRPLAVRTRSAAVSALTSRNLGAAARARVAEWNPDLIASNEGGSNQILVRGPARIETVRRLTLTRKPERRVMLWTLVVRPGAGPLAVANLHASTGRRAAPDVLLGAERAVEWAGGVPLLFGGDLNLRPRDEPAVFGELRSRFGLTPPGAADAIDHLLSKGLEIVEPPRALPGARREVPDRDGLAIRLSDHAPVTAAFARR
jgi:endonuclease/exonuclease/phosphatase family metal-dependent hydrolase